MNIEIKTDTKNTIPCTIILPNSEIEDVQYNKFIHTLTNSNFLIRITEKTGLKWIESKIIIEYAKEAEYKDFDTVLVDYNRGSRAVSSTIHESFHLMLRQINWTENPTVRKMINNYPELINSSSHGIAYKMEQMFAYLLQNEIYQEIAKDLNFDASKDYWDMDFIINNFIPYEFDTPFLKELTLAIIEVWNSPRRSNDIFLLIAQVDRILMK